jgi:hypothetical protein
MNRALSIFDENSLTDWDGVRRFVGSRDINELRSFVEAVREAIVRDAHSSSPFGMSVGGAWLPYCSDGGPGEIPIGSPNKPASNSFLSGTWRAAIIFKRARLAIAWVSA